MTCIYIYIYIYRLYLYIYIYIYNSHPLHTLARQDQTTSSFLPSPSGKVYIYIYGFECCELSLYL